MNNGNFENVLSRQLSAITVKLTREQLKVLKAVQSGRNVFFTGGAGTGKSFLLKRIIGKVKGPGQPK